jgi:FMN phosphatase YigB (HAD superfamily)
VSLTLLLDLDDTLLDNSMADFLPAYLQAISSHLASYVEPDRLINTLMNGTRLMILNQNPDCTLQDVFSPVFYPIFSQDPQVIDQAIARFYAEVFPQLKSLTRPRPHAVQLVEQAFSRSYRVAIATAPLFPRTAILQRISWAGFSAQKHPFAVIPSFETFHFAKPNPAYLAELLAQMGWPEGPVVMLGDDLKMDIHTAQEFGLPSYWIQPNGSEPLDEPRGVTGKGGLEDFFSWLDSLAPDALQPDFSSPHAMLAILRATPAALNSMVVGLSSAAWSAQPENGGWSLTEVLCHLRDVDTEVNLPRLQKVRSGNNPFLPGIDTDLWAGERAYPLQNGLDALHSFTWKRIKLLELLDRLTTVEWTRPARHAIFGPTNLQELVSFIAGHDRLHIRQVYELVQAAQSRLVEPI